MKLCILMHGLQLSKKNLTDINSFIVEGFRGLLYLGLFTVLQINSRLSFSGIM